ncbi:MAG: DnaJ domain-containing protein [Thermoleophilia bacterium]|nr:DnaJ domain-containing protein [Thermoleophilia bacterium]
MDVTGAARMLGITGSRLTDQDLSGAWRRFAREHHPDARPGDPDAARRFIEGRRAYEVLRCRVRQEREAGWDAAHENLRRMGRVVRGERADMASPYRFSNVASREWRA